MLCYRTFYKNNFSVFVFNKFVMFLCWRLEDFIQKYIHRFICKIINVLKLLSYFDIDHNIYMCVMYFSTRNE